MMRALHFTPAQAQIEASLRADLDNNEILTIMGKPSGLLWVDLEGRSQEYRPMMESTFQLHPLAIDDALKEAHIPKIDDWGPYLYIVLHVLDVNSHGDIQLEAHRLDVFLHSHSILTLHDSALTSLERVWTAAQVDTDILNYGPVFLLYRLAEAILDTYSAVGEWMNERVEKLKNQVFEPRLGDPLEEIIDLKRNLLVLQSSLGPQREVFKQLINEDYRFVDQRSRVYFRDIDDHLIRLAQTADMLLDQVDGLLSAHQALTSTRLSMQVKTLTLIVTIFLPLACIFGFFGMNFFITSQPISALVSRPIFVLVFLLVLALPFLVWWLRRRGWL
jgi:magnesium transporter